ncbi:hypothetical protein [Parafrankia discariae]|uniref:hypothetical protein n=1 Tax=Parafrankia discariae TaxID=365528 RepID=UPI00068536BE|nr:hypothetical protein [Parafrankia discariae]
MSAVQRLFHGRQERAGRVVVVRLPYVTARLEVAPPPRVDGVRIGPLALPSAKRTAYYAGLGALAAIEIIEWPIAAAIAAGTYVSQHSRSVSTGRDGGTGRRSPSA